MQKSTISGLVGIWWIYNNQVIADALPLDSGYNDRSYIHYDENRNHLTEWSRLIKNSLPPDEASSVISEGYKSLERGRVLFNIRTRCYEVICSEAVYKDLDLRNLIVDYFELRGCRYDFIQESHYHIAKLTGNPALDQFEYGG